MVKPVAFDAQQTLLATLAKRRIHPHSLTALGRCLQTTPQRRCHQESESGGAYFVAEPGELMRLLAGIARNKVAAQARRHGAGRREFRRAEGRVDAEGIVASGATPSQVVAGA